MKPNSDWTQTVQTNIGPITMIVPPRHITPGLRKPYEYKRKMHEIKALCVALKKLAAIEKSACQIADVTTKRLAYGVHIEVFFLSHPGFCEDSSGHTKEQWTSLASALVETIKDLPDAKPYVDEWDPNSKFDMRYDVYIAAEELL